MYGGPAIPHSEPTLTLDLHGLQGALDGGLDIPHSDKRFVGYSAEDKELDAETLRKYIYGGHVSEYMENLQARSHSPRPCALFESHYPPSNQIPNLLIS